jgi:hypothetical protein
MMKRKEKRGLLFLLKKVFDEKEDYRVRLYILTWIASICATLALVIGGLIFLFRVFGLFYFMRLTGICLSFPG